MSTPRRCCCRTTPGSGTALAEFPMSATDETAFVFGELYRRAGGWKFRAVGQGYASGLAGLAADFGISVDDDPEHTTPVVEPAESPARPPGPQPLTRSVAPPASVPRPAQAPPRPAQAPPRPAQAPPRPAQAPPVAPAWPPPPPQLPPPPPV